MEAFSLKQAISFHIFINYSLLIIVCINLITLFFTKDFVKINKISFFLTPLLFGFLFIDILSGISVLAITKFKINIKIIFMIIASLIFLLEFLRIKKIRIARQDSNYLTSYIKVARILNIIYLLIILLFLVF
ncbi:hypothetical protein [Helicobacter sp. MIT 14-3879]|uniref:hypothetical protein n=1 Tax=Helicobacter sp. MIT 14-3879 TaxID=2040649 RepID=UPI000E1F12B9|nr:hypothetical protein [Helicobacter sp. MIT 14-3879]RDU64668.1 hypothetical protein CQA44_02845 [Helicobacter sp. MIT 14-3879]